MVLDLLMDERAELEKQRAELVAKVRAIDSKLAKVKPPEPKCDELEEELYQKKNFIITE